MSQRASTGPRYGRQTQNLGGRYITVAHLTVWFSMLLEGWDCATPAGKESCAGLQD